MYFKSRSAVCQEDIVQLAHGIVSTWISECSVALRPRDRHTLKKIIAQSILEHIRRTGMPGTLIDMESVKEQERRACVDAIANLKDDPFHGFVCKQRALNALLYHSTLEEDPMLTDFRIAPGANRDKISARDLS